MKGFDKSADSIFTRDLLDDVAEKEKTRERLQQLGENNSKLQDMVANFLVNTQTAPSQKLVP